MVKRSLLVLSLTLVLVSSAVPVRPVYGVLMTPEEIADMQKHFIVGAGVYAGVTMKLWNKKA